jgi:uncharacterized protein (DUF2235 family)
MPIPKQIAVFLDGTWNNVSDDTNVWRMKSLCASNPTTQIVYYSAGVGTEFGGKLRGGLYGYGLNDEITNAYKWLIDNFEPGDELFIFGFSRGAYTARSLSGFISKCGLLEKGAPLSVSQLFNRYRRRTAPTIRKLLDPKERERCALGPRNAGPRHALPRPVLVVNLAEYRGRAYPAR